MTLENLAVTAMPVQAGWQLAVKNPVVEGDVFVPTSTFVPIDVNLRRLSLNSVELGLSKPVVATDAEAPAQTVEVPAEVVKVIDPRKLPLANISVQSLLLDDKDYGTWSLQLRPDQRGVVVGVDVGRGRFRRSQR